MSRQLAKHWITADEYERMGEAGIFSSDSRLELIEGEVYEMSPIGSPHAACVTFLSMFLSRLLGDKFIILTQNPIRLDDFSEPQPDIALLRWRDDFYRTAHPRPADILLLVEVADTTLQTDRVVKIPLYAKAAIPEAWIVNLPEERIEIYAEPSDSTYQFARSFHRGEDAQAHSIQNLAVNVSELLG
jgi:Uma2 family endonuclease